tara:strand:+ start:157 stop:426 length:270 start_codon:yes stop_codon:yes gene_type:complete
MKRIHVTIKGKVVGVFFRKFIKENAKKLNLNGWVKNNKNHVEAVFEGNSKDINKMLVLCNKGPETAEIKNLNFKQETIKGEKSFKILRN